MRLKDIPDNFIEFIFSKDKRKYLILMIILGFILRFIAVSNIAPTVADEMVHGSHAIGISSSGVINQQNEAPVWFYLTDISYRIFGVNAFSARFLSLFFGLLTIPLIYIITKKMFNEKIALISSFLLTISSFYIRYALMEMDEAMIFFILLSFYYFTKGLEAKKISYFSIVFMAVAFLIKPIAVTFIPAFAIFYLLMLYEIKDINERNKIFRENIKRILLGAIIFLIFMSPILVYNYLLYQEKKITDIQFARFFKVSREIYAGLAGYDQSFSLKMITERGPSFLLNSFPKLDPIITLFGIIGILMIFFCKNKQAKEFLFLFLIPFIFLMGTAILETHFVIFIIPLSVFAAFFIVRISEIKQFKKPEYVIHFLIILILLINLYILWPSLSSKSAIFKAREFAIKNVAPNDIVAADARIYRGRIVFMFHDKHYIESSYLSQIMQQTQNLSGIEFPVNLYFVECVIDDCGWGTISNQPDFNKSIENMVDFFKNNSQKIEIIYGGGGEGKTSEPYFNVYKLTINIKPQTLQLIDSTHQWFYYPVMWKGERYDSYTLDVLYKRLLHKSAYLVLWFAILIAIISPFFIIYEVVKDRESFKTNLDSKQA